MDEWVGI